VSALTDSEIVKRVRAGDRALFEVLMRRHNQRVYRAARAIVKDESEAEDVMQQAYLNAFTHLGQFEERAQFSTWLTRITVNEALARRHKLRAAQSRTGHREDEQGTVMETMHAPQPDPKRQAFAGELHPRRGGRPRPASGGCPNRPLLIATGSSAIPLAPTKMIGSAGLPRTSNFRDSRSAHLRNASGYIH